MGCSRAITESQQYLLPVMGKLRDRDPHNCLKWAVRVWKEEDISEACAEGAHRRLWINKGGGARPKTEPWG